MPDISLPHVTNHAVMQNLPVHVDDTDRQRDPFILESIHKIDIFLTGIRICYQNRAPLLVYDNESGGQLTEPRPPVPKSPPGKYRYLPRNSIISIKRFPIILPISENVDIGSSHILFPSRYESIGGEEHGLRIIDYTNSILAISLNNRKETGRDVPPKEYQFQGHIVHLLHLMFLPFHPDSLDLAHRTSTLRFPSLQPLSYQLHQPIKGSNSLFLTKTTCKPLGVNAFPS